MSEEGGPKMCEHDRLRTVGDRVFCCECNKELPIEFLMAKNGQNSAENNAEEEKKSKPATRKRTAKKTV